MSHCICDSFVFFCTSALVSTAFVCVSCYSRRGNFGGSVYRCVLWLNNTFYRKVSEEVNRKCPSRNTTVILSTPYNDLKATMHRVTDGRTDRQSDNINITIVSIADHTRNPNPSPSSVSPTVRCFIKCNGCSPCMGAKDDRR